MKSDCVKAASNWLLSLVAGDDGGREKREWVPNMEAINSFEGVAKWRLYVFL